MSAHRIILASLPHQTLPLVLKLDAYKQSVNGLSSVLSRVFWSVLSHVFGAVNKISFLVFQHTIK